MARQTNGCIAVINAGSSSIKFALYDAAFHDAALYRGQIEQIGVSPHLRVVNESREPVEDRTWSDKTLDHQAAVHEVFNCARELIGRAPLLAIGHRVVHGGTYYSAPVRIDAKVINVLEALTPLAPLHQPHNLSAIVAVAEAAPHDPQVACFDTAFHRSQPKQAQMFALPRRYTDAGVRRYGFHGLSYEYVTSKLKELAPTLIGGRVVIAHLGNGASLCALHNGQSVATTMGFTAVDGLVMGTRCGAIDPGVLIYLMDAYGMDARALEKLVYRESGLLGVSGISSDMRTLRASSDPAAAEAIGLFVYWIIRETGSLCAALGGLDGFVFTGGIGENDAATRAEVGEGCRWLGLQIDQARNTGGAGSISSDQSRVSAWVIPTDEERMIARHTAAILGLNHRMEKASK